MSYCREWYLNSIGKFKPEPDFVRAAKNVLDNKEQTPKRSTDKACDICDVSNRRELLINFCTLYMGDENSKLPDDMLEIIDLYLKN